MVLGMSEVGREEHKMVAPDPAAAKEIFGVGWDVFGMARVGRRVVSSWPWMSLG